MLKFIKGSPPDVVYRQALKKPIPVKCLQINEPFTVETMEGIMTGKKGDWLMIGIHGEMYPCDKTIFEKTYSLLE